MKKNIIYSMVAVALTSTVYGQVVNTYSDQIAFNSAVTSSTANTLESFSAFGARSFNTVINYNGFDLVADNTAGSPSPLTESVAGLTIGGSVSSPPDAPSLTLTFTDPNVNAFLFFWNDTDGTDEYLIAVDGVNITTGVGSGSAFEPGNNLAFTGVAFFGVVASSPITTVTFTHSDTGGIIQDQTLSSVTTHSNVNVVPEPSSTALLGLGGLALLARRRR